MSANPFRPSDTNQFLFNPLEDPHFADTIQDFLTIFTAKELESKPYLQAYLVELLARWGRWLSRGRAPALCFEAACVGGLSFLKKTGRESCELTGRADAALARLLAGMVIDEVEPMARKQGGPAREKAIGIVADEFLAKIASSNPSVANSAKKRMKKRKTVIKTTSLSEDLLLGGGAERRPSFSSEASYSPRPVVGVDRRPSLGDGTPNPNAGYPMQQRPQDDYYTRGNIGQLPPNVEPIPGPNSYYAGSSYGRGRKISNDSTYSESYDRSAGASYQQQQQQAQRYPSGNQRVRQASVPYSNEGYFEQPRARQASEGGYDNRPAQYFSDPRFLAGQKGRKTSLEGLPSSLVGSSSGVTTAEYHDRLPGNVRPRKPSSESPNARGNYQGSQFYQNQQQPINPSYADSQQQNYNSDYVVRPRKNSGEPDPPGQFRSRAGSVDRSANASRYDGDNRSAYSRQQSVPSPPIGLAGNRRPSQQPKGGFYQQQQRSRFPSNGDDPFERQTGMNMRASPPKPTSNVPGRTGNMPNYSQQQYGGDSEYFRNQQQPYRGDPNRRPSQDPVDLNKRRPSHEEANPNFAGGRGPIRSRTPTLDYRGAATNDSQFYNPALQGGNNRGKPTGKPRVDDLGNYLQSAFLDDPPPGSK